MDTSYNIVAEKCAAQMAAYQAVRRSLVPPLPYTYPPHPLFIPKLHTDNSVRKYQPERRLAKDLSTPIKSSFFMRRYCCPTPCSSQIRV